MEVSEPSHKPTTAPNGSGRNERDRVTMSAAEIDRFLSDWHVLSVATHNRDGTIHLVPMWYGFLDGQIAFHTKAKSQKIANLRRDATITCLVEEGDSFAELRGVQIVGRAEIVEDPQQLFALGVSTFERSQQTRYDDSLKPRIEALVTKRVGVKVHADRYASWDHRKLG